MFLHYSSLCKKQFSPQSSSSAEKKNALANENDSNKANVYVSLMNKINISCNLFQITWQILLDLYKVVNHFEKIKTLQN